MVQKRAPGGGAPEARQALWRSAKQQMKKSMDQGFYLEAVTLQESMLSDRIESLRSWFANEVEFSSLGGNLNFISGRSIASLEIIHPHLDAWRKSRNLVVHQMIKFGENHAEDWQDRITTAQEVALKDAKLLAILDKEVRLMQSQLHVNNDYQGEGIEFRILTPASNEDSKFWSDTWWRLAGEPQSHPQYCVTLAPENVAIQCAYYKDANGEMLFPFEVRNIPITMNHDMFDAITPYGYGGAYAYGHPDEKNFWRLWQLWARLQNIVSLTVRSHLFSEKISVPPGVQFSPFDNVSIDLTPSEDEIWESFEGRVRTDVRRGRREQVEIEIDEDGRHLEEFYNIYCSTMEAHNADPYYYFSLDSLRELMKQLHTKMVLFHAWHEGTIVASEMNLLGDGYAYYFLSGALPDARKIRANPTMKVEVIKWLKAQGIRQYILGGGLTKNDQLFKYKKAYSPTGIRPFTIVYHEVDASAAEKLIATRRLAEPTWNPVDGYSPTYRAPGRNQNLSQ